MTGKDGARQNFVAIMFSSSSSFHMALLVALFTFVRTGTLLLSLLTTLFYFPFRVGGRAFTVVLF